MTKKDAIRDVVLKYVQDEYVDEEGPKISYETPLISGGIVDSFSMMSLRRFLEARYNIKIPDHKATPEAFDNVDSITALVEGLLDKD